MRVRIEIPEKLNYPLRLSTKKHRLVKGGRGGGKSESIARVILEKMMQGSGNVLCSRSVQNSIEDSVYSLLSKLIIKMELTPVFRILKNAIIYVPTGSRIIFKGCNALSDPKSESAKGLDEFEICWIEEAHTITERDVDILIPSIRKEGAVFFWSYNSNRVCYVDEHFREHSNAEITTINYWENPFCPQTLIEEAEECLRTNPQKFREIWKGEISTDTTRKVIINIWIESAIRLYQKENDGVEVYGLDVSDGGDDNDALARRKGLALEQLWQWEFPGGNTIKTAKKAVEYMGGADSKGHLVFDRVGVGSGVKATMIEMFPGIKTTPHNNGDEVQNKSFTYEGSGVKNKDTFGNFGAQHWFFMRELFENAYKKESGMKDKNGDEIEKYITINPQINYLLELKQQLLQIEFRENERGLKYIVKAPKGTKSPNLADATMMSFRKPKEISGVITI